VHDDDELDLPAPRRRSDPYGRVLPAPRLFPDDPVVRRNTVLILLAPLALIGVLVLVLHLATSSSEPSYDGGLQNSNGVGGYPTYGAQDTTDAYGDGDGDGEASAEDTSGDDATSDDTATATDTSGEDGLGTGTPTPTATGPAGVVQQYFAAINQQDYQTAWQLGGDNLGESYQDYSSGFSDTEEDDLTVDEVDGDVVTGDLTAHNDDGSVQTFSGTFTVDGGVIAKFDLRQTD
jgi:hypothetical protein